MDERTRRNLCDAGCSEEFQNRYAAASTDAERLRQLRRRRHELLNEIHADQRRLDCLDYLIYQLKAKAS